MEAMTEDSMAEMMRGKIMTKGTARMKASTTVKMVIVAPTEMINMDITAEVTIMAMVDMDRG